MLGLLSHPLHRATDYSSGSYQLFPQSQSAVCSETTSSTSMGKQHDMADNTDVIGTSPTIQCTCDDNTMAVFWDETHEPCLKCGDRAKADSQSVKRHRLFTRQNGIDSGHMQIGVDIHGLFEEAEMEETENSDTESSTGDKSRGNQHNVDYGFSTFSDHCSDSEKTVVEYEEDMTSTDDQSNGEEEESEEEDSEETESDMENESNNENESETEQVVPSCQSDEDIGPMLSSLYETDDMEKLYESRHVDAKLRTRFVSSGEYSGKSFSCDSIMVRKYASTLVEDFGATMGKLQITGKYRFPRLTPTEIEEIVNFWEMDFQVGQFIVPRLGSWEAKGLIPNKDRSPDDYHRYEVYRDLYRKWLHCNQSLEQWYSKYGYMTLESVLHSTGKGHKRKYRTERPLSARSRSPLEKRICLANHQK